MLLSTNALICECVLEIYLRALSCLQRTDMNAPNKLTHLCVLFYSRLLLDAKDLDQLNRNKITHMVSIHESPQPFIPVRTGRGSHTMKQCDFVKGGRAWELVCKSLCILENSSVHCLGTFLGES